MTKKRLTHVASFKRGGNDWDWVHIYDLSDEQLYTLAMGSVQATGDFPPLLPIGTWCEVVDHFTDEERRAYHRDYIHLFIQQPTEEA